MMKYTNLIKLLSVLLCAILLLTACTNGDKVGTDTADGTDATDATDIGITEDAELNVPVELPGVLGPVDPVLKNFFTVSTAPLWNNISVAERIDGENVSQSTDGNVIVMRSATVDHLNNVKETFTVYNVGLQKTVLTLENTYKNGDYDTFAWGDEYYSDPELRFPESMMKVEIGRNYSYGASATPYVKVSKATVKAIDKATFEANEGDSHEFNITYDYYDIGGTLIASSNHDHVTNYVSYDNNYSRVDTAIVFGGVAATFDPDTHLMISKVGADNKIIRFNYTTENELYGYYMNLVRTTFYPHTQQYFEVYSKADNSLVLRYELDVAKGEGTAFALASGDIMIQYKKQVEADSQIPYDCVDESGNRYRINTYIVDVLTGETKQIDCNYEIFSLYNKTEFAESFGIDLYGVALTDKAQNIAIGRDISAKKSDADGTDNCVLVFDNDGTLMYQMEKIIPEHIFGMMNVDGYQYFEPFGYIQLASGDYLVSIKDIATNFAIVTPEGKVRSYLRSDAQVVGSYVVQPDGLYDYDLNRLFDFRAHNFNFEFAIGNKVVLSSNSYDAGASVKNYYTVYRGSDTSPFYSSGVFNGEAVSIVEVTDDYVIVKNNSNGKYSMYNAELQHILTTKNEMTVFSCDGSYMVGTMLEVDGKTVSLFYKIS